LFFGGQALEYYILKMGKPFRPAIILGHNRMEVEFRIIQPRLFLLGGNIPDLTANGTSIKAAIFLAVSASPQSVCFHVRLAALDPDLLCLRTAMVG